MDEMTSREEKMTIRKQFSRIGRIYFIFAIAAFVVQIVAITLVQRYAPNLLHNSAVSLLISMAPLYGIATPLCIWMMQQVPAAPPIKKRMKPSHFLAALVMTFAGMYLGNIIGLVITAIIGVFKGSVVNNDIVNLVTQTDMWGTVLIVVLIAPVVEEFLFRKLLIDRVVKYGEGIAVLLSGLMFGLFHGNLNQFFYAFIIGSMFAFLYVKTGNIWYTVIMHMIINFFGSVVAVFVLRLVDLEGIEALQSINPANTEQMMEEVMQLLPSLVVYLLYMVFFFGVILTGVILLALNRRKFTCSPGESGLTKKEKLFLAFSSTGMILYIIFWVVMMIIQLLQ